MPVSTTKLYSLKALLQNEKFILFLWILLPLIAGVKHATRGVFNDYRIYKSVFYHTIEQVNLYLKYPELNGDSNHYGPIFSLLFGPFALLPDALGTILWDVAMCLVLFYAIYKLPVKWNCKVLVYYFSLQGLYSNAVNSETNAFMAALIIGAFICIYQGKDFLAAFFISLGVFIKLYSIVGLAFFFFSRSKMKLIASLLFWSAVFFLLPMIISSPQFIIQCYQDWYDALLQKNVLNIYSINQDISVMGMIRRIFGVINISNIAVLIPAILVFALQYIRIDQFNNLKYQLGILSSTLLFVVLFSTGSETCTYIIATVGASIWFVIQDMPYRKISLILISFTLLTVFLSSGLMPSVIRNNIIKKYALQVIPFFIIWLRLAYQLIFKTFNSKTISDGI